jgi:hypothetical protein
MGWYFYSGGVTPSARGKLLMGKSIISFTRLTPHHYQPIEVFSVVDISLRLTKYFINKEQMELIGKCKI